MITAFIHRLECGHRTVTLSKEDPDISDNTAYCKECKSRRLIKNIITLECGHK